jgi:tRNA threonylcarbamoyladenosine biosynthesis protein TsaB
MIVGIDGASTDLSLAMAEADGTPIAEVGWTSSMRQSAELLPRLLDLLSAHGRALPEMIAVAVGIGPGSFTGLRVALAVAKGLAYGLDRPIVGIPSLEAWLEAAPDARAAVGRAGANEAYVLGRDDPDVLIADRDAVVGKLGQHPVVAPRELAEAFGLVAATPPRGSLVIARRAAERLVAGSPDDVATLEPLYVRAPRGIAAEAKGSVRWL